MIKYSSIKSSISSPSSLSSNDFSNNLNERDNNNSYYSILDKNEDEFFNKEHNSLKEYYENFYN